MAVIPPWAMDRTESDHTESGWTPEYDGATLRMIQSALLGAGDTATTARPGVLSGLGVTVLGEVAYVSSGLVVVTTSDGSFVTGLSAEEAFPLEARHPTNPRTDRVVVEVVHEPDEREGLVRVIAGEPAPSPSAPSTPVSAESLGTISVPEDGGPPAAFNPGQRYTAARGGIISVPSESAMGRVVEGTSAEPAYATVGGTLYVSTGSGWSRPTAKTLYEGQDCLTSYRGSLQNAVATVEDVGNGRSIVNLQIRLTSVQYEDGDTFATVVPALRPNTFVGFPTIASSIRRTWSTSMNSSGEIYVILGSEGASDSSSLTVNGTYVI